MNVADLINRELINRDNNCKPIIRIHPNNIKVGDIKINRISHCEKKYNK